MVEFAKVAGVKDIPNRRSRLFRLEGEEIALWNVDGKFYALNNICPHQHFSMLHQGTLDGLFITCPMHGWTFCLEDGMPKTGNGRAKTYQVKVEGEDVFVEKPERTW